MSSLQRLEDIHDVAPIADVFLGFEALTWFGWIGPAGLPNDVAAKLIAELKGAGAEPALQARLKELSAVPSGLAGEEFGAFIRSELGKWGPVVERAGIKTP